MHDPDQKSRDYDFVKSPRVLVARSSYRRDVIDLMVSGVTQVLEAQDCSYDFIEVHGSLELPGAIAYAHNADPARYDAYVAVGCILKGETMHDEIIGYTAFQSIQALVCDHQLAIGNGILTVNTPEQAEERANPGKQNRGAEAAFAALDLLQVKQTFSNTKAQAA